MDVYYERIQQDNEELYEKVTSNTGVSQDRMKRYYDRGAKASEIGPGDWVLVKDECRPKEAEQPRGHAPREDLRNDLKFCL